MNYKLKEKPSVGIIMRTKNRPVLLQRAIKSVLGQSYDNWQLIIVNDGGEKEKITYILQELEKQFPNIHFQTKVTVIHNEKSMGMEAASNKGIANSKTDLLIIHDDDDSWSPVFLQRMIAILLQEQKHLPSIQGIVCHSNRVIEEINGNIVTIKTVDNFNTHIKHGVFPLGKMLLGNDFPQISFLFFRSVYDELEGFNELLPVLGDWDFNIRFLLRYDIWVLPELLAFYHHRLNIHDGDNGNIVIAQKEIHLKYRQFLINKYLREMPLIGTYMAQKEYLFNNQDYNRNTSEYSNYEYNLAIQRINFVYEKIRAFYRPLKKIFSPLIMVKNLIQRAYCKVKFFLKKKILGR